MYKPKMYTESDSSKIWTFIEAHPFAFITSSDASGQPVATQVPLILSEGKKSLRGHIMKHTDHHKAFLDNPQVLVVFSGPNAYISGSWYSKPNVASTWNYMSVQLRGTLKFLEENEFIKLMKNFTLKFEGGNQSSPTIYNNIPEDYLKQHMQAITGFEIYIDKIEATFKLSQNKDKESFANILKELNNKSHQEQWLAEEMQKNNRT